MRNFPKRGHSRELIVARYVVATPQVSASIPPCQPCRRGDVHCSQL